MSDTLEMGTILLSVPNLNSCAAARLYNSCVRTAGYLTQGTHLLLLLRDEALGSHDHHVFCDFPPPQAHWGPTQQSVAYTLHGR